MTVAPDVAAFRTRFERTVAGLNVRLQSHQFLLLSKVFRTVSWRFQDLELRTDIVSALRAAAQLNRPDQERSDAEMAWVRL